MMLLVSGATKTVRQLDDPRLGVLHVPRDGNRPTEGKRWACDNGAYSGFDEVAFRKMLDRMRGRSGCLWVAAPDVVGSAVATRVLFDRWQPEIATLGFPVALVAQNGLTIEATPWDRLDCLFIGGDDAFKLGSIACGLITEAKARGKLVHMGRVNTLRRLRYAFEVGVDSVDGTKFSRFPETWLRWGLNGMARHEAQGLLFR